MPVAARQGFGYKSPMVEPQSEVQRIGRLMPLADALACIDRLVKPVAPRRIKLGEAVGLTLAEPIANRYAHPGSAIALRDGVAVDSAATLDASSYAPAPLAGAPAFVDVGDPLPAGADAVAPLDAVELRERTAQVLSSFAPGDGVLPQGGDAAPGDVLGRAGARLRASDVTSLSVLGVTEADVRWPPVRIDVAHGLGEPVIASIVNLLSLAAEAGGARVLQGPHARFDAGGAAPTPSAVMLIGGSGSGRRDDSVRELARLGSVAFHGVALSPGETAAFGMVEQRPILVVPGRLDAALAVWLTLGRRMVARLAGRSDDEEAATPAVLTRKITSTLGLSEIVLVRREAEGVEPLASGYLTLQSLLCADGYVIVPPDSEGFPAGARVDMRSLP
jgi:molybdopterin biosynthesis enzyme